MKRKIALIHVTINAVQPMIDTVQRLDPEIEVLNFLDEGILQEVNQEGGVTSSILLKFINLLYRAVDCRVDGILLTCSVFSPFVKIFEQLLNVPIVSIDGEMLKIAATKGSVIGILATVESAGPTTAKQIFEIAEDRGLKPEVKVVIVKEAFSYLQNGKLELFDKLIQDKIMELSQECDVIVLAQLSMARAASNIDINKPILTSPETSFKSLIKIMEEL